MTQANNPNGTITEVYDNGQQVTWVPLPPELRVTSLSPLTSCEPIILNFNEPEYPELTTLVDKVELDMEDNDKLEPVWEKLKEAKHLLNKLQ